MAQVDRAQSNAVNLQVLKRQDADVMEIVDTASHVVMYEFDQDAQSWVRQLRQRERRRALRRLTLLGFVMLQKRKDVEGCLFVVKRCADETVGTMIDEQSETNGQVLVCAVSMQIVVAAFPGLCEQSTEHDQHEARARRTSSSGQCR